MTEKPQNTKPTLSNREQADLAKLEAWKAAQTAENQAKYGRLFAEEDKKREINAPTTTIVKPTDLPQSTAKEVARK